MIKTLKTEGVLHAHVHAGSLQMKTSLTVPVPGAAHSFTCACAGLSSRVWLTRVVRYRFVFCKAEKPSAAAAADGPAALDFSSDVPALVPSEDTRFRPAKWETTLGNAVTTRLGCSEVTRGTLSNSRRGPSAPRKGESCHRQGPVGTSICSRRTDTFSLPHAVRWRASG